MTAAELSEAALSLDNTRTSGTGRSNSTDCPRKGYVRLGAYLRGSIIVPTNCKTWGCKGCRDRVMSRFRLIVSTGVSILGPCGFVTVTYKAGSTRLGDAKRVSRDWKALWRLSKKSWWSNLKWLRIVELTKKGTPHHHIVIGPIPRKGLICIPKQGQHEPKTVYKRRYGKVFSERLARCDCLAHAMGRAWKEVTSDSWMVHAVECTGAAGAGGYMAKYLGKEFDGGRAAALGMQRRWSTSHGWPGTGKMEMKRTSSWGWHSVEYQPGYLDPTAAGCYDLAGRKVPMNELGDRRGPPILAKVVKAKRREAGIKKIESMLGGPKRV